MENLPTLSSKIKDSSTVNAFSRNLGTSISNYHKNMTMRRPNLAFRIYCFATLCLVKVFCLFILVSILCVIFFATDAKFYNESMTINFHYIARNYT